jgi:hypothetical protein
MEEFGSFKRGVSRLKGPLKNVVKGIRTMGYGIWVYIASMDISNRLQYGEDTPCAPFRSLLSTNRRAIATSQPIASRKFNQATTYITCINSEASCRSCACTIYQAAAEHETWTAVWAGGMTTKRSNSSSPRRGMRASCSCVRSRSGGS